MTRVEPEFFDIYEPNEILVVLNSDFICFVTIKCSELSIQVAKLINNEENIVWTLSGNQANAWYQRSVKIGRTTRPFQVDILATRSFDVIGESSSCTF